MLDLAEGHVAALSFIEGKNEVSSTTTTTGTNPPGFEIFNLGSGKGYSVMDMIEAMGKASGKPVPYVLGERRSGDIATCFADASKAEKLLHWKATRSLDNMCEGMCVTN